MSNSPHPSERTTFIGVLIFMTLCWVVAYLVKVNA